MTSPTSGHITIANKEINSGDHDLSPNNLQAPAGNVVMISFQRFSERLGLTLHFKYSNGSEISKTLYKSQALEVTVYDVASVTLKRLRIDTRCFQQDCFKMVYSFNLKSIVPHKLRDGLYNCNRDDYWRFQQNLDCNEKIHCEDARDETGNCPVSSPACRRWGASGHRCYRFIGKENLQSVDTEDTNRLTKAIQYCSSLNGSLGQLKDVRDIQEMLFAQSQYKKTHSICNEFYTGLYIGGIFVPNMYRKSLVSHDRTILHYSVNSQRRMLVYEGEKLCYTHLSSFIVPRDCSVRDDNRCATCAFTSKHSEKHSLKQDSILLPNITFALTGQKQNLTKCSNGQVTHSFLSNDPHYECKDKMILPCTFSSCSTNMTPLSVFKCDNGDIRLSYTLVCDFRPNCKDKSDESFCKHPPCDAIKCDNGQCASHSNRCDTVSDCLDDSDEKMCRQYRKIRIARRPEYQSPVLIMFDSINFFNVSNMEPTDTCPVTHYQCPGEYKDCLPVFTRCNGWYDCLGHEDEDNCETMTCPGYYKCFMSSVCVYRDHLCDGWPHCPQHDDEWLCDMTCPTQCECHGHAFLCPQAFSAHRFPEIRYLNAHGSKMTPHELRSNFYVVWLVLSKCSLMVLPSMTLHNLQFLDLSDNYLKIANISVFTRLTNLQTVILSGNPIHLFNEERQSTQQTLLNTIDLSHTNITVFDSRPFAGFSLVQTLNLSYSPINTIYTSGFRFIPRLTNLYMEGTAVEIFPADMFKSLPYLRIVTAQTYKLCCKEILPSHAELVSCSAPTDEISSCADLLQSETYRGFLVLIGILSLLGNVVCLLLRVCAHKRVSISGFHVFVTNLSLADLLMGVYVAIIGVADGLLRGKYLILDREWKHSVACKMAGFLSLLSCEVSALIIWLITLDRFIVLHFPFSTVRFKTKSAAVACLITWLVGLLLALTPLLPMTSHWEFFSQTGICIPLPVTRQDFKGKAFSVSVFVVFNFVLFILIAAGQAFIYWSVQKNALNTDRTKTSRDMTIARRLISVAVTDFLCWFPIGLCGFLALGDIPISGEVNVALAIFVLPLNSALNPFMYTFNMVMEKRRKSKEAMLIRWLESHSDLENN